MHGSDTWQETRTALFSNYAIETQPYRAVTLDAATVEAMLGP
jgi:hypothetical protein